MDRGISTVLDVCLACLLVTASATLLITTPSPATEPPDADRIGRAILPSTIAIESTGVRVETSIGDVLVSAASDGAITREVRSQVEKRVREVHRETGIVASVNGRTPVEIGPEPNPGVSVDAAVFRVGDSTADRSANPSPGSTTRSTGTVVIVVRTWSP